MSKGIRRIVSNVPWDSLELEEGSPSPTMRVYKGDLAAVVPWIDFKLAHSDTKKGELIALYSDLELTIRITGKGDISTQELALSFIEALSDQSIKAIYEIEDSLTVKLVKIEETEDGDIKHTIL